MYFLKNGYIKRKKEIDTKISEKVERLISKYSWGLNQYCTDLLSQEI